MIPHNSSRTIAVILIAAFASMLMSRPSNACGPFFTDAIFVFSKHPDFPLERFATGQIGVLQPTYARSYLVAAYRNLTGEPLNDNEVAGLKSLWSDRLDYGWEFHDEEWIKKWNEVRNKVPGVGAPPEVNAFRHREKPNEYETYLNCQQDAFENAEATLTERIKQLGADSPQVREWVQAQDIVFSNCGAGETIPDATSSGEGALAQADRSYQIAAAHFYAAQFDEATRDFDLIARDSSSPWHDTASYLAARSLLRKGSLADKPETGRPALADAESRLRDVINDKSLARSHHAATRLLNLVRVRLHPEEKVRELAKQIVKRGAAPDFKQSVWDYTVLLDKFTGDNDEVRLASIPDAIRNDDLTDWIFTFQDGSVEATSHAIDRWQKTKSLAWLVAAISKAGAQSSNLNAILDAAGKVDHQSAAFASLRYQTARLLIETNRHDDARTVIDNTLANDRKFLPPSTVNLLLTQKMLLATNLDEFLQSAQLAPAGFSDDSDGREIPEDEKEVENTTNGNKLFFDADAANVMNKLMPVAILKDAGDRVVLASNLRRDVRQAAFMRAALIDDRITANQAATALMFVYPELKELLSAYQRATTTDARRFAAAYVALKFPGLRPYVATGIGRRSTLDEIDSFRDNWWCAEPPTAIAGPLAETEEGVNKPRKTMTPEFLKASQSLAGREASALHALGTGPNYLCRTVIDFATTNPADARVPEALHLAVKSTRYGCTDAETGRWSKAAFDLLHRRYPNTTWAKETKYWFKG